MVQRVTAALKRRGTRMSRPAVEPRNLQWEMADALVGRGRLCSEQVFPGVLQVGMFIYAFCTEAERASRGIVASW